MKKKWVVITASVAGLLVVAAVAFAVTNTVYPLAFGIHSDVYQNSGAALNGYDAVAYFEDGKAIPGQPAHLHNWNGARWHFASRANLERFRANPQTYAPQFGGYCAFAVSKGFTASADPEVWHIREGQLYVFDSEEIKSDWLGAIDAGIIDDGVNNWR